MSDQLAVSTAGPTVPPGDKPEHGGGLHPPHRVRAVDVLPRTELAVWMPAVFRDPWLRGRLEALLQDGAITKATLLFRRPGRKVFVRLSYATPGLPSAKGSQATFGPIRDDSTVWVRSEHRACSFTDRMDRLRHMKTHWAGIHRRLRQRFGKRGRRQDLRFALVKAGLFTSWVSGPLHQWSREIVTWCQRESVASLVWAIVEDGTLPWDRLAALTRYKCAEAGIAFSQLVASETPTDELRTDQNTSATQPSETLGPQKRSQARRKRGTE